MKKVFLKTRQNAQENICAAVSLNKVARCEIFKNTYFLEHLQKIIY